MWYNIRRWGRQRLRTLALSLLDVVSQDEFTDKDQKLIQDWLFTSAKHRGFEAYIKARDRSFVGIMVGLNIENKSDRKTYTELAGRRLENARLLLRAEKIVKDREKAKKAKVKPRSLS